MNNWRNWAWVAMMILLPIGACIDTNDGDAGLEPGVHPIMGSEGWYKVKIAELEAKIENLGSLALEANDQWMECLNTREEDIERYRSVALNCAEELKFFRPDSTQVIDGIIYERAAGSHTAANNGVMKGGN